MYKNLDKKLRLITSREKEYQKEPFLSPKYKTYDTVNHEGEEIYVFSSEIPKNETIAISKQNRFAEVPTHIHTYLELNYVYSGQCTQVINGETTTLIKGQICIVDTGVPHSIYPAGEDDIIINILIRKEYFTSSFLSRLSNQGIISNFLVSAISDTQNHNKYIIFHSENNHNLQTLIRQLLNEYFNRSICSDEMIGCYMILMFSELLRVFHFFTNQTNDQSYGGNKLIEILHFIEENYKHCTLVSTASHFSFNPNYLSSLIKKGTQKTFKELIQIQRIQHSSLLLSNTTLPIYEIAYETGHGNLSYFYKKFKEHYNLTPQEYRKKHT